MIYDIKKSFHENIEKGPFFSGTIPERTVQSKEHWATLFDYSVISSLGISACPFTATVRGVELCSKLGFDFIVWKTIRSRKKEPHAYPNVTFISPGPLQETMYATDQEPQLAKEFALANSIGNASYNLESTLQDITTAKNLIKEGQILFVSLYGVGDTQEQVVKDFEYLAERVSEINVDGIELNLSCPNVCGSLYDDLIFVKKLVRAAFCASTKPITVKIGLCKSYEHLRDIMRAIAEGGARGISGINSVPAQVLSKNNKPFFGEVRATAGISGAPILPYGLKWVVDAAMINATEKFALTILGGGGITCADQFNTFLNAGADVAMCATGALYNPRIASEYHNATLVPHKKGMYEQPAV